MSAAPVPAAGAGPGLGLPERELFDLAAQVVEAAVERGWRLAIAESLTGGALAAAVVTVPGASRVLSGAIVAYDTALKHRLLGVDARLLAEEGPVAAEVAKQMARGVRIACAVARADHPTELPAELGIATTGVAGPDPDPQSGQAAGTVWLGLSLGDTDTAIRLALTGDRSEIRAATVAAALTELLGAVPAR